MMKTSRLSGARRTKAWHRMILSLPCLLALGCDHSSNSTSIAPPAEVSSPKEEGPSYVLVGAGDIASCKSPQGAAATAKLIEQIPGTVFAAGDLAYEKGTAEEFSKCYGTTWGKFKDRTRPVPGNHEYYSQGGQPYFKY